MPTHSEFTEFVDVARTLATTAGNEVLSGYSTTVARRKFDGTLVTKMDEQSDALISAELARLYPGHAILSEEQNTVYDPALPYTWVIDPIDGTTNFARGIPIWGVSISLLYEGTPIVSVLYFPSLQELYWGATGHGAFLNDLPLTTAADQPVDSQHLIVYCTRTLRRYQVSTPLKARLLGSAAYHIAKVADGSALAGIEATPKLWDLAGAYVILKEAGGCMQTLTGEAIFPLPNARLDYESRSFPCISAASEQILTFVRPQVVANE